MDAPFNIPFDTQLAFLWNELTGKENRALRGLRSNNQLLPRDYARLFEELYERAGGKGMNARMNNAATVYSAMQSEVPDLPRNAIRAYRFLTDKGLSGQQAAGVVGNLMAESYNEIRPNAYNPEGGGQGAYGIAQWRGPRLDALNAFAEANKPRDAGPPLEAKMNGNKPMSLLRMPQNLKDKLSNPLQRDPMTGLNPLQSLAAGMDALVLRGYGQGQAIREKGLRRAAFDREEKTRNATVAELERVAKTGGAAGNLAQQLLAAVKSGAMTPADAYKTLTAQLYDTSGDKIRSSVKFQNGAYYVITDKGRKVYNKEGMLVPEGPQAAEVLREAELSGIAMEGLSTGTTEAAKFQQKSANDAFEKADALTAQIATIDRAIAEIDGGAQRNVLLNMLPDITAKAGGLNSALRQMGLDVVSSVTFGALSQSELDIAMATAYPPNANEQELRIFLVKRKEALEKLRAYTEEAASFLLNPNNTKADWMEIVRARRDQQASEGMTNPYMGMSLAELNDAYAGYAQMSELQKTQFRDALKAAQANQ